MSDNKKVVVFELHVTVDDGDNAVERAHKVAINAINYEVGGDFRLDETPARTIPSEETEKIAKEFIDSSPTDKADLVEDKVLTHNPTVEEYENSPTPEINPGTSIGLDEDPMIKGAEDV